MNEITLEQILVDALADERKAEATYAAVVEKFGPVRPFTNIISAEQRHSGAIERQMERLGIPVPANSRDSVIAPPTSLAAACEQAIEAEIENISLYDRLIPMIRDEAVAGVFRNLQAASRDNHLPAFRRCHDRELRGGRGPSGEGGGRGGRGRGWRGGRGSG
jgi:rubrerythrin